MPNRQFVACTFKPGEGRPYTFHNDGEPVSVGDKVHVQSRGGTAIVHVCAVDVDPPTQFETKPIIGRVVETVEAGDGHRD